MKTHFGAKDNPDIDHLSINRLNTVNISYSGLNFKMAFKS